MFTGIITGLGTVREARPIGAGQDARFVIVASWPDTADLAIGASVCCGGCCLTVVARDAEGFTVDVSAETLARTTLGAWRVGTRLNLERALRVGDELGGHLVSGHVDGVATLVAASAEHGSRRLTLRAPRPLARFIAEKGSVALDGVSLTVNAVEADCFGVNIIPHTEAMTTLHERMPGDALNLEIDTLARYVARLAATKDWEQK